MQYYYPEIEQTTPNLLGSFNGSAVWTIVSLVLALVGGLVVYFLFFKPDKKMPNKYLEWIKEFFNFHKMLIVYFFLSLILIL